MIYTIFVLKIKRLYINIFIAFIAFFAFISIPIPNTKAAPLLETSYSQGQFGFFTPGNGLRDDCVPTDGSQAGTFLAPNAFGVSIDTVQTLFAGTATFGNYVCGYVSGTLGALYKTNQNQGALNYMAGFNNTLLEQRPLSTQDYLQDKVFALTGRVSAAEPAPYFPGTGSDLLQPIQTFWGWSVNIVYGFLILIIIGIAFSIVFQQKIGGKETVQIQNAIPSIAMAMILVPLSYAISGVFIDAIAVGTNVVHSFFFAPGAPARELYNLRANNPGCADPATQSTGTTDDPCDRGLYVDDERINVWNFRDIVDVSDQVQGVANSNVTGTGTAIDGNGINSFIVMDIIRRVLDFLAGPSISGQPRTAAYWFGEIINAIVSLMMVWIGIKIAWRLLKKYITLILAPVAAPFIFASVAVPGNSTKAVMNYIKLMGSASAMYIVTYLMFIVTYVFTSGVLNEQLPNFQRGIFIPPLLGLKSIFESIPTSSSQSFTDILFGIVGLGVYFSIPKTLDDIDKALGGNIGIPAFITTPIDALKDSAKVTFRSAPALGARGAIAGGRLARNGVFAVGRGAAAIEDTMDRARGITPGVDSNSAKSRRRQRLLADKQKWEDIFARAKQSGNTAGMAYAQARLSAVDTFGEFGGSGVGFPGEADKAPTLEVTGNELIIPVSRIRAILAGGGALIAGNTVTRPAVSTEYNLGTVKLVIQAKGEAKLFPPMSIFIGTTTEQRGVHTYAANFLAGGAELITEVNSQWSAYASPVNRLANSPTLFPRTVLPLPTSAIGAFSATSGYMESTDGAAQTVPSNNIQLRIGAGRTITRDVFNNRYELNVSVIALNAYDLFSTPLPSAAARAAALAAVGGVAAAPVGVAPASFELSENGTPNVGDDGELALDRALQTDRRSFRVGNATNGLTTPGFRIIVKLV